MKKTLTVNLEGIVFQIDEDAYILLDEYLKNLRYHFRKEEGGEEIVRDMEMRIGELFTEEMEGGQTVITLDNVEAVIVRMGRPEQLDEDSGDVHAEDTRRPDLGNDSSYDRGFTNQGEAATDTGTSNEEQQTFHGKGDFSQRGGERVNHEERTGRQNQSSGSSQSQAMGGSWSTSGPSAGKVVRKLYRDPDNRILGGVLSGIAAYCGWDPTVLRLIVILFGLTPYGGFPLLIVYFILQCVLPMARTATEKLQMRGEPVNVENIGKTVTDGFEREGKNAGTNAKRTGFQRFLDVLVIIFGVLLKIFIFFLLIFCIPIFFTVLVVLFVIVMSVFGIFVHIPGLCMDLMPDFPWHSITVHPFSGSLFLLTVLLIVGIPLFGIIQTILHVLGFLKPMSPKVKLSLVIIWVLVLILGLITFFLLGVHGVSPHFIGI